MHSFIILSFVLPMCAFLLILSISLPSIVVHVAPAYAIVLLNRKCTLVSQAILLDEDDFIALFVARKTADGDTSAPAANADADTTATDADNDDDADENSDEVTAEGIARSRELCAAAVTQLEAYSKVATVEDVQ